MIVALGDMSGAGILRTTPSLWRFPRTLIGPVLGPFVRLRHPFAWDDSTDAEDLWDLRDAVRGETGHSARSLEDDWSIPSSMDADAEHTPGDPSSADADATLPEQQPEALGALLAEAATGSQEAWRVLVDLYGRRVYALAKSRLRNHDSAEEITQSVFVTVSSKVQAGEYGETGRFEAWLFRIAINRIRDEIRRQRRHADPVDPGTGFDRLSDSRDEHASADAAAGAEQLAHLRRAMASLGDADREVLELRHHAAMTFKQIADLLHEPVGTLLARHHRALKKLREIMETDTERPGIAAGSARAPEGTA